jgi:molybdopterin synthase catalytic subunit
MAAFLKVLAFAGARDVIGQTEFEIPLVELEGDTAGDVMDAVCRRYPELEAHRPIIRLAVNGSYVAASATVAAGDEVALIPPVAGG